MKKIVLGLSVCAALLFAGCSNFLNGSDLKEKVDESIEWADEGNNLKIIAFAPTYQSSGSFSDSIIEIRFNKSINISSFDYSIRDGDAEISDKYLAPQFYENNTFVKIRPNLENRLQLAVGDIRDLTFTIRKSLRAADNSKFSREDYISLFRVNSHTDNLAPETKSLNLYKSQQQKISELPFELWNASDECDEFIMNHTKTLIIKSEAKDAGVGPSGLKITEELICNSEGHMYENPKVYENYLYMNYTASINDSNLFEAETVYNYKCPSDGVLKLTLQLFDANENFEDKTNVFYVIKDTKLDLSFMDWYTEVAPVIYTNTGTSVSDAFGLSDEGVDINSYLESEEKDILKWSNIRINGEWYPGYAKDLSTFTFTIKAGTSFDNLTQETTDFCYDSNNTVFVSGNELQYWYTDKIKLYDIQDTYVVITAYDDAGNDFSFSGIIPKKPTYISSGNKFKGVKEIRIITDNYNRPQYNASDLGVRTVMYYLEKTDSSDPEHELYKICESIDYWPQIEIGKQYYAYFKTYYYSKIATNLMISSPVSERFLITPENKTVDVTPTADFDRTYTGNDNQWIFKITLKDDFDASLYDCYFGEVRHYGKVYTALLEKTNDKYFCTIEITNSGEDQYCVCSILGITGGLETRGETKPFVFEEADYKSPFNVKCGDRSDWAFPNLSVPLTVYDADSYIPAISTTSITPYAEKTWLGLAYKYVYSFFKDDNGNKFYTWKRTNVNNAVLGSETEQNFYDMTVYYGFASNNDVSTYEKYDFNSITGIPAYIFKTDEEYQYFISPKGEPAKLNNTGTLNGIYDKGFYCNVTKLDKVQSRCTVTGYTSQYLNRYDYKIHAYDSKDNLVTTGIYWEAFLADEQIWVKHSLNGGTAGKPDILEYTNIHAGYSNSLWMYLLSATYLSDMFVRIWSADRNYKSTPFYIYLDGDEKYGDKGKIFNLLDSGAIITLLCDAPAYVHTLYADVDMGENLYDWEMKGISLNEQIINESQNINIKDTSKYVPDGFYYVTVAWSKDGTPIMGKVRQK